MWQLKTKWTYGNRFNTMKTGRNRPKIIISGNALVDDRQPVSTVSVWNTPYKILCVYVVISRGSVPITPSVFSEDRVTGNPVITLRLPCLSIRSSIRRVKEVYNTTLQSFKNARIARVHAENDEIRHQLFYTILCCIRARNVPEYYVPVRVRWKNRRCLRPSIYDVPRFIQTKPYIRVFVFCTRNNGNIVENVPLAETSKIYHFVALKCTRYSKYIVCIFKFQLNSCVSVDGHQPVNKLMLSNNIDLLIWCTANTLNYVVEITVNKLISG